MSWYLCYVEAAENNKDINLYQSFDPPRDVFFALSHQQNLSRQISYSTQSRKKQRKNKTKSRKTHPSKTPFFSRFPNQSSPLSPTLPLSYLLPFFLPSFLLLRLTHLKLNVHGALHTPRPSRHLPFPLPFKTHIRPPSRIPASRL